MTQATINFQKVSILISAASRLTINKGLYYYVIFEINTNWPDRNRIINYRISSKPLFFISNLLEMLHSSYFVSIGIRKEYCKGKVTASLYNCWDIYPIICVNDFHTFMPLKVFLENFPPNVRLGVPQKYI